MKQKLLTLVATVLIGLSSAWAETDYTSLMPGDWTINATNPGNFQSGKEAYNTSNYGTGKIIYQSFSAPATGIYEIKFYAVTSSTSGRGFVNIFGDNIAQAYVTAGTNKTVVPMTVINQTGCTLADPANIRTLSIEVNEGETIEYGLENIATGGNWYTIQTISAKMKTVAEIYQAQYDEALAIYNNSTENETGAKSTFKTAVDALGTAIANNKLAPAQEASANLVTALTTYESKSYPVKGSGVKYDFTSKMNMAINAWTCKQGNGPNQYGFTGATETYGNTTAGEVMYQTITGLANGEYEIHFYAVSNAANGGGTAGQGLAYVYANETQQDIEVISQSSCTPSDYERTLTVMVKDGTLKYGITNTAAAGNWNLCKNVALYMTGAPDLSDYYEAISDNLTTASGLQTSIMNSTVLGNLQDAVNAAEGYESIAVIGTLETINNNLITAKAAASTSIENYNTAKAILDAASTLDEAGKAAYAADETIAAIQTAYDDRTLEAVTDDQKTACTTALSTAIRAQTTDGADMTLAINNNSFETGDLTGWTAASTAGDTGVKSNSNNTYKIDNADGDYLFNTWNGDDVGYGITQKLTDMPAGEYTLTALFAGAVGGKVDLIANKESKTVTHTATGTGTNESLDFKLAPAGDITIGTANADHWYKVDNFRLTLVHKYTDEEIEEATLDAILAEAYSIYNNTEVPTVNVGTDAFQYNEEKVNTYKNYAEQYGSMTPEQVKAMLKLANKWDETNLTTLLNTIKTAVAEMQTLNAPSYGERFYIVNANSGQANENKAAVITDGTPGDNNPTGYGIATKEEPSAQIEAFTFTQVEGNTYNISVQHGENVLYLTYGSLNGSAAGWNKQQIQLTPDETKKGEFIISATETEGVYNIYNTVYKDYIDIQDGGSLYTDTNIDKKNFKFSPELIEVPMVVNAEYKWATFCAPFDVEIPEGVTAYTVDDVLDAAAHTLAMTPVETTIPANTPVVLYSETGVDKTFTGTPTYDPEEGDLPTEGLLTGVYLSEAVNLTDFPGSYLLSKPAGCTKVAFYPADTEMSDTHEPYVYTLTYKAFLTLPNTSDEPIGAKALFFNAKDAEEATAIEGIEVLTAGDYDAIYNAAGAQVKSLQKGVNIIKKGNKSYKIFVK